MRFGILTAAFPGRAAFRYAFTPADIVWVARFIVATGGDRDPARRRYQIWRLFERFASYAYRYQANAGGQAQDTWSFRGFMRRYMSSVPRTPWNELPAAARGFAVAVASGRFGRPTTSSIVTVEPSGAWQSPVGGGYAPYSSRPQYGSYSQYSPYSREAELMEVTPGDGSPPPDSLQDRKGRRRQADVPPPPPIADPASAPPPTMTAPPDDPDADALGGQDAGDFGDDPGASEPQEPSSFTAMDGSQLVLNPNLLRGLNGRRRRWYQNRFANAQSSRFPFMRPRSIATQLAQLARRSQRIGTLRHRTSGRRYPVFGGRAGNRNFRIVTRPRGGMHFEIMNVQSHELAPEQAV